MVVVFKQQKKVTEETIENVLNITLILNIQLTAQNASQWIYFKCSNFNLS